MTVLEFQNDWNNSAFLVLVGRKGGWPIEFICCRSILFSSVDEIHQGVLSGYRSGGGRERERDCREITFVSLLENRKELKGEQEFKY